MQALVTNDIVAGVEFWNPILYDSYNRFYGFNNPILTGLKLAVCNPLYLLLLLTK